MTWPEARGVYLAARAASLCTQGHLENCARACETFARLVPVCPADLRSHHVIDYLNARAAEGLAPQTLASVRGLTLAWLNWLTAEGLLEDHHWDKRVPRVRLPQRLTRALAPRDLHRFLLTASIMPHNTRLADRRDLAMIYLLADAGLRQGELRALRLEEVDLTGCCVRVRHGKGDRERVSFFGEQTRNALRRYLNVRPKRFLNVPWFFVTRFGTPPSDSLVLAIVHRIGRACGLEVTPHMLRHSCATQLLRSGMSLPALSKQLGHASMRSTERYLHLLTEDLQREYRDLSPVSVIMGSP